MKKFIAVLVLVSIGGCSGLMTSFREKRQADLRQRAAFEFKCPAEQMQITPLDEDAKAHGGGTTGVSGCGQQATYVWNPHGTGWVMNSQGSPQQNPQGRSTRASE